LNIYTLSNGDIQLPDYKYRMDKNFLTINWIINKYCNLRCSYCVGWHNASRDGIVDRHHYKDIADAFLYLKQSAGKRLYIDLTGGEPSLVPNFIELINILGKYGFFIGIQTNLCTKVIKEVVYYTDPEKLIQIEAAYHYETLDKDKKLQDMYFENFSLLSEKGFTVVLKIVATPKELKNFEKRVEWLRRKLPEGSIIFVQPYITGLAGTKDNPRSYPYIYTDEEKKILSKFMKVRKKELFDFINGAGWFKGMRCGAGESYLVLDEKGNARRCASLPHPLGGNLMKKNIRLLPEPTACPVEYCACPPWALWFGANVWEYIGNKRDECLYCRYHKE